MVGVWIVTFDCWHDWAYAPNIHILSTSCQFVFGDMNYRMRLQNAEEMVQRVAATARALEASVWYVSPLSFPF